MLYQLSYRPSVSDVQKQVLRLPFTPRRLKRKIQPSKKKGGKATTLTRTLKKGARLHLIRLQQCPYWELLIQQQF